MAVMETEPRWSSTRAARIAAWNRGAASTTPRATPVAAEPEPPRPEPEPEPLAGGYVRCRGGCRIKTRRESGWCMECDPAIRRAREEMAR